MQKLKVVGPSGDPFSIHQLDFWNRTWHVKHTHMHTQTHTHSDWISVNYTHSVEPILFESICPAGILFVCLNFYLALKIFVPFKQKLRHKPIGCLDFRFSGGCSCCWCRLFLPLTFDKCKITIRWPNAIHTIVFRPKKPNCLISVFVLIRIHCSGNFVPGTIHTNEYSFSSGQKLFTLYTSDRARDRRKRNETSEQNMHTFLYTRAPSDPLNK